jgi:hypothetical protein
VTEPTAAPSVTIDDKPPTRLVYAEDLVAGQLVEREKPCQHTDPIQRLVAHRHELEWAPILDVRSRHAVVSAIVLDGLGEQQAMAWNELTLVRVRADQ